MKRFDDVQFITATEAAKLYRDRARGRKFTDAELQGHRRGRRRRRRPSRSATTTPCRPSEVFALLNEFVADAHVRAGHAGASS